MQPRVRLLHDQRPSTEARELGRGRRGSLLEIAHRGVMCSPSLEVRAPGSMTPRAIPVAEQDGRPLLWKARLLHAREDTHLDEAFESRELLMKLRLTSDESFDAPGIIHEALSRACRQRRDATVHGFADDAVVQPRELGPVDRGDRRGANVSHPRPHAADGDGTDRLSPDPVAVGGLDA